MSFDIIGDNHGHADQLEDLLLKLGYQRSQGAWRHSDRTAIFVGDLIDRGPGQLRTLKLVREMTDAGTALITMGNHELNAIAWATPDPKQAGHYLRARHGAKGIQNRKQHSAFLSEVGEDSDLHRSWIAWFREMPLWIETPEFRVVHACWSQRHIDLLKPHLRPDNRLSEAALAALSDRTSAVYCAIDTLRKGQEVQLPDEAFFTDKEGHVRREIRTRWWNPDLSTYRSAYIGPKGVEIPDLPIVGFEPIAETDCPTFIGHYWLDPGEPIAPLTKHVACLDYSVAQGGPLVAYRFDGNPVLSTDNFVSV